MKQLAGLILTLTMATAAEGREWYVGGTLHGATAAEWRAATSRNRLATSADFAISSEVVQMRFQRLGMAAFRADSRNLMVCIDTAVDDPDLNHFEVPSVAVACLVLLDMF